MLIFNGKADIAYWNFMYFLYKYAIYYEANAEDMISMHTVKIMHFNTIEIDIVAVFKILFVIFLAVMCSN